MLKKFRMDAVTTEVQWSQLQRDPKGVAQMADAGDVVVRRRDGVPLLLTREDRASASGAGSVTAARALRNVLSHLPASEAAEFLRDEFPWIDRLPREDLALFVVDFARAVQASAELGDWSGLTQVIVEWQSTALAYSDPALVRVLTEPIEDDLGEVPSPGR
jgi:hypothetical protein